MLDITNQLEHFNPRIYVVDDEEDYRDIFSQAFAGFGATVRAFASAADFLEYYRPGCCECLLTDNQMPGMTGLELQKVLAERYPNLPVIIITGAADVCLALDAVHHGVFEFIEKPCSLDYLQKRIKDALAKSMMLNLIESKIHKLQKLYEKISTRESQVLKRVLDGVMNKNIAHELGISEKTVEAHRNNIKNKLMVTSFGEVFYIVSFLRNTHKDYISLLEEIDINKDIMLTINKCENPTLQERCYEVLLDLTKDDDLESCELYGKMEIIVKLIELFNKCEFANDNFCRARSVLTNINVI